MQALLANSSVQQGVALCSTQQQSCIRNCYVSILSSCQNVTLLCRYIQPCCWSLQCAQRVSNKQQGLFLGARSQRKRLQEPGIPLLAAKSKCLLVTKAVQRSSTKETDHRYTSHPSCCTMHAGDSPCIQTVHMQACESGKFMHACSPCVVTLLR